MTIPDVVTTTIIFCLMCAVFAAGAGAWGPAMRMIDYAIAFLTALLIWDGAHWWGPPLYWIAARVGFEERINMGDRSLLHTALRIVARYLSRAGSLTLAAFISMLAMWATIRLYPQVGGVAVAPDPHSFDIMVLLACAWLGGTAALATIEGAVSLKSYVGWVR